MRVQSMIEEIVLKFPKTVLVFFVLLTGLAVTQLPKIVNDPSPYLLPKTHESRVNLAELRDNFTGSNDGVLVMLEAEKDIFNAQTFERVLALTERFEELTLHTEADVAALQSFSETVTGESQTLLQDVLATELTQDSWEDLEEAKVALEDSGQWNTEANLIFRRILGRLSPIVEVTSLANTDNILGTEGELDISPIYEDIPESAEEFQIVKSKVLSNELFDRVLVSENGKYTGLILESAIDEEDSETQQLLYATVQQVMEEIPGSEKHHIAGFPVATSVLAMNIQADTQTLLPIVFLLVILFLAFSFRMFKGVLAPLLVVILSLILTMAAQALLGMPTNIITTALPVFILSIGVADGIHIFSEFRDHLMLGKDKAGAVRATIRELSTPVIMTSLTTGAAFWSLSFTEIVQMRHFGILVAIGTLVAMVYSLLFIPALLLILPQSTKKFEKKISPVDQAFNQGLTALSLWVLNHAKLVLGITVAIVVVSIAGASLVQVDNDLISYFESDMPVVTSTDTLNEHGAGSSNFNILVKATGPEEEPLKTPENLLAIDRLVQFLEQQEEVGKVVGFTPLIKRINYVLNESNPAYDRIPNVQEVVQETVMVEQNGVTKEVTQDVTIDGKTMIAQLVLLYENGGGDTLSDVVDTEYTTTNINAVLSSNSSKTISTLFAKVRRWSDSHMPAHLKVEFSGSANINVASTEEIVSGQVVSFLISIVITLGLLMVTFRSWSKGILAMMPLMSTILVNFGIMGFFNVPLNVGTAVVSSIVIGIGVDYSIHYLSRLQENLRSGQDFQTAVLNTVQQSGKAITFNALTVGVGFIALLFSVMSPLFNMGWMISMTMVISAGSTIILIPAILAVLQPKFVKTALPLRPAMAAA